MEKLKIEYKRTKNIICYLLFSILLIGECSCQDKNVVPEKSVENTDIYYYKNNDKQIISPNDTLSLTLKSTITIYVDSANSPKMYAQSPICILENDYSSYNCYARESALSGVMVVWNNNTESMMFYINISPLNTFFNVGETNFIINVSNESLKEVIQEELIENHLPDFSAIKLSYKTLYDGDWAFVYNSEEIICGSFKENGVHIDLFRDDQSNTIYYVGETSEREYAITQDLTNIFKEQYPSANIQEIVVVTTLMKVND